MRRKASVDKVVVPLDCVHPVHDPVWCRTSARTDLELTGVLQDWQNPEPKTERLMEQQVKNVVPDWGMNGLCGATSHCVRQNRVPPQGHVQNLVRVHHQGHLGTSAPLNQHPQPSILPDNYTFGCLKSALYRLHCSECLRRAWRTSSHSLVATAAGAHLIISRSAASVEGDHMFRFTTSLACSRGMTYI